LNADDSQIGVAEKAPEHAHGWLLVVHHQDDGLVSTWHSKNQPGQTGLSIEGLLKVSTQALGPGAGGF